MSAVRLAALCAGLMALLSPISAQAGPFMEWLCGCSPNMSAQSTYAPAYVPTAVVPAQAAGCSCAQQTTYYAPAAVYPAAVTAYRPFLPVVPRPTTTYYTPPGYNPYSLAPVTVYRPVVPVQPVVTTTRLIPYTSYRMVYPTMLSYYGAAPLCNVAPAYVAPPAPCAVPESGIPVQSCNQPPVGPSAEGEAMEAPSLPPGQPSTTYYPPLQSPSTIIVEKPIENPAPAPVTRQDNKPETSNEPKAAPQGETKKSEADDGSAKSTNPASIQHNSLSNPPRDDSQDRTTMRPVRQISRNMPAAIQPDVRILSGDLWRPAKD